MAVHSPTMTQTFLEQATGTQGTRERVFSGIQPSGASHLGNYLGAQANYVALQDRYEAIYAIVDLHALTTVHDGATLRRLSHEMILDLLAVGLDPERCAIIRQSDFPERGFQTTGQLGPFKAVWVCLVRPVDLKTISSATGLDEHEIYRVLFDLLRGTGPAD